MHRREKTSTIIKQINLYQNNTISIDQILPYLCDYYDFILSQDCTNADKIFLRRLSNIVGIPQYYQLLENKLKLELEHFNLSSVSSIIHESTLHTDEDIMIHRYQKKVLDLYKSNKRNRHFLSASTSFGKTFLVYEILRKMNYKNIFLIFPTIALLGENLERILSNPSYHELREKYKIHTLSNVKEIGDYNIFIFTPERYLSFIDSNEIDGDFTFIDEVYKIDNSFILDEVVLENERDIAYRLCLHQIVNRCKDILLVGPYIDYEKNGSFNNFLLQNKILPINFNKLEIVNKKIIDIKRKQDYLLEEGKRINLSSLDRFNKTEALIKTVQDILNYSENLIIYCYSKASVESYAKKLLEKLDNTTVEISKDFMEHIKNNFQENWILYQALNYGIGIHHGLVPKYIQKEIISLFNSGVINILISTTTITEGVNTSAKNLIVLHDKKGNKDLNVFDAKNIAGRAGRFMHHYNGRVISIKNNFSSTLVNKEQFINHLNYAKKVRKSEFDIFMTSNKYMNKEDKINKNNILREINKRDINPKVFDTFKAVKRTVKISVYDKIKSLTESELESVKKLITRLNYARNIEYKGFQLIIDLISDCVTNNKLRFLMTYKKDESVQYTVITHLVYFYLKDGFKGLLEYKLSNGIDINKAIRESSEFVYNLLKYQLVKYLGTFNIVYKSVISKKDNKEIDEIPGIDILLNILEYNAITTNGKIVSDYGVPYKVIKYFDYEEDKDLKSKIDLDDYEKKILELVTPLIENE